MSKNLAQMSKRELINQLANSSADELNLNKLTKKKLLEKYKENQERMSDPVSGVLNSVETDTAEDSNVISDKENLPPSMYDPEWSQFILGHLKDDEVENDNPRVEGLRRLANIFVGDIMDESVELIQSPNNDNGMHACVKASITFTDNTGSTKRFEALADAHPRNTQDEFAYYPTALAETRAKGRCFRSALMLKRILAAEEKGFDFHETKKNDDSSIRIGQKSAIKIICDRCNISIRKTLEYLEIPHQKDQDGLVDLNSLTFQNACSILDQIQAMERNNNIPSKIKRS